MTLHTLAPDRRTLVKAISEHLGQEAIYCGPPTFAYNIGAVTVDREGLIHLPDDMDANALLTFLVSKGWLEPETNEMTISVPVADLTVKTIHNLILMLYSKQYLLGKALKAETIRIDDAVTQRLAEAEPENPADFNTLLDDFKAQGHLAGVDFADDRVTLSYPLQEDEGVVQAYTLLTVNVIAAAKAAVRVQPERQQPENEKYYMRSWLVRLGFGGKDAKGMRDILLKHLKGHSAFPSDVEAQKHRDKYAEIRKIKREISAEAVQHEQQ